MSVIIRSDNSSDELRIDSGSKAARVSLYDTDGNAVNAQYISEFGLGVLSGKINNGARIVTIEGMNPDIDNSTFETIWNNGGIYTGFNATGSETVEIFSSSANDAAAGTGARTIRVYGLSGSGQEVSEIVSLNGVTSVYTTNAYFRMSYAEVITAGSGTSNAGTITARQSITTANIFFLMPIGFNRTAACAYTIPAGYNGYVKSFGSNVISKNSSACEVRLITKLNGALFMVHEIISARDNQAAKREFSNYHDQVLPPLSDLRIDANSDAANTSLSGFIDLVLLPI